MEAKKEEYAWFLMNESQSCLDVKDVQSAGKDGSVGKVHNKPSMSWKLQVMSSLPYGILNWFNTALPLAIFAVAKLPFPKAVFQPDQFLGLVYLPSHN